MKLSLIHAVAFVSISSILMISIDETARAHNALQITDKKFPIVENITFSGMNAGSEFQVSNDGKYIFDAGEGGPAFLEQMTAKNGAPLYYFGHWQFPRMIGWSPDNNQVAMITQGDTCTYPDLESQVILFNTNNGTHSGFCIPISSEELHPTTWSPFSNSVLFMQDKWLIDTSTHAITQVALPKVSTFEFPQYINTVQWTGLGQVLWDTKTQQPFGLVKYYDSKPGRAFYICPAVLYTPPPNPLYCTLFYQITDPSSIVYVASNWKLSTKGHFLLWMSSEIPQNITSQTSAEVTVQQPPLTMSPSSNSLFSPMPIGTVTPFSLSAQITPFPTSTPVLMSRDQLDTVLYTTEIPSGITKELYRWHGIKNGGQYIIHNFDWSVDGGIVALSVEGTHAQGTLLMSLQWP